MNVCLWWRGKDKDDHGYIRTSNRRQIYHQHRQYYSHPAHIATHHNIHLIQTSTSYPRNISPLTNLIPSHRQTYCTTGFLLHLIVHNFQRWQKTSNERQAMVEILQYQSLSPIKTEFGWRIQSCWCRAAIDRNVSPNQDGCVLGGGFTKYKYRQLKARCLSGPQP